MENRYEEEQVVEFNLLDAELLSVRDERNLLREKLDKYERGNDSVDSEFRRLDEEQRNLLQEAEKERIVLGEHKHCTNL